MRGIPEPLAVAAGCPAGGGVSLARLSGWRTARPAPADAPWAAALAAWVADVVAAPEPALKRRGAVCPFLPPALDRDLVGLVDAGDVPATVDALSARMHDELDAFLRAAPRGSADGQQLRSVLVAFPQLGEDGGEMVREVRVRVKPAFLARGATCGEFYPVSEDRSVRNPEHRVARSPVPCIAIRHATPHDELFLRSQPELYSVYRAWKGGAGHGG